LTRVALPEGELIVNSSRGGGSKDTWVLAGTGQRPDAVPEARRAGPAPTAPQDTGPSFVGTGGRAQQQQQQQQHGRAPC